MRYVLIYLSTFLSFVLSGQRIINFNLIPSKNAVTIRFTITPGSPSTGYTIYHSTDSLNFIPIVDMVGNFGASGANEEKTHTHSNPSLNLTNFYKVELFPVETTPVKRIYLSEQVTANMVVYPNPVYLNVDILNIKILNTSNIHVVGFLYNQFGTPVDELDLRTTGDLASIYVGGLTDGLYVLWLTDGNQAFASKFIVKR